MNIQAILPPSIPTNMDLAPSLRMRAPYRVAMRLEGWARASLCLFETALRASSG